MKLHYMQCVGVKKCLHTFLFGGLENEKKFCVENKIFVVVAQGDTLVYIHITAASFAAFFFGGDFTKQKIPYLQLGHD